MTVMECEKESIDCWWNCKTTEKWNFYFRTVACIKFCAPHFFRVHNKKHGTGSTLYDGYCNPGSCMTGNIWLFMLIFSRLTSNCQYVKNTNYRFQTPLGNIDIAPQSSSISEIAMRRKKQNILEMEFNDSEPDSDEEPVENDHQQEVQVKPARKEIKCSIRSNTMSGRTLFYVLFIGPGSSIVTGRQGSHS